MTGRPDRHHTGLGRGIAALIPQRPANIAAPTEIPLARIRPNPYQPRRSTADKAIEDLAASIREHGVLQPILVTEVLDGYQLVAGERRYRAAELAGLERIPAVVRNLADRSQLELALVENIQRADLNPMEEAHAYRQLADEFGLSQDEIAKRVGRARATVANTLRLLDTDPAVQVAVTDGHITEGHARAIGGLDPAAQVHLLGAIVSRELSVRQAEELARRLREPRPAAKPTRTASGDPDLERVEEDLRRSLGTKVSLARTRRGGRIVIEYYSDEELDRLYERLTGGTS
ncbi:MAG TPA: ParB/RepB/Spo0J family partition protein [Candidatus Limnocylindria bacterium]|nr:ParB/RepB/Spo0J family partition protein [Candidatus Limnocylindria bacterium]